MVSIAAAVTGLLLTGMVAFALTAGSATPSVDAIPTVVTDRPVREPVVATPPVVKVPAVVVVTKPVDPPAASGFTSRLIATARKSVRAGVSPKPIVVPGAIVVAPRPGADSKSSDHDDDGGHEVVTPGVRDDTDDDDARDEVLQTDSHDRSDDSSKPAFYKGD